MLSENIIMYYTCHGVEKFVNHWYTRYILGNTAPLDTLGRWVVSAGVLRDGKLASEAVSMAKETEGNPQLILSGYPLSSLYFTLLN